MRQLIDAESGGHLWAERFDKPLSNLFSMQDDIVASLASQLGAVGRSCIEQRLRDGDVNVARLRICRIRIFPRCPGSIPVIVAPSESRRSGRRTC